MISRNPHVSHSNIEVIDHGYFSYSILSLPIPTINAVNTPSFPNQSHCNHKSILYRASSATMSPPAANNPPLLESRVADPVKATGRDVVGFRDPVPVGLTPLNVYVVVMFGSRNTAPPDGR
jgi:hypothetical protein